MATELNKQQWIEILSDPNITLKRDLKILQALYDFPNHEAAASQIVRRLNYKSHASLNSWVGYYAKRIAKFYAIQFTLYKGKDIYYDFIFDGYDEKTNGKRHFIWQIKPAMLTALEELGLTEEQPLAEEIPVQEISVNQTEGLKKTIVVNAYERNRTARDQCIKHHGTNCSVCDSNFEEMYGEIGAGYIHVHHIVPISTIGKKYIIDPVKDLRPVCPNCHAMLHRQNPPLSIDALRARRK